MRGLEPLRGDGLLADQTLRPMTQGHEGQNQPASRLDSALRAAGPGQHAHRVSDEMRASLGIASDKTALLVEHVGAFAPHDRAKQAGVVKNDVLVEYDGRRDLLRETDVIAYAINQVEKGRSVPMRFLRGSQEREVEIATAK